MTDTGDDVESAVDPARTRRGPPHGLSRPVPEGLRAWTADRWLATRDADAIADAIGCSRVVVSAWVSAFCKAMGHSIRGVHGEQRTAAIRAALDEHRARGGILSPPEDGRPLTLDDAYAEARRDHALFLYRRGASRREIAARLGCHPARAEQILANAKRDAERNAEPPVPRSLLDACGGDPDLAAQTVSFARGALTAVGGGREPDGDLVRRTAVKIARCVARSSAAG